MKIFLLSAIIFWLTDSIYSQKFDVNPTWQFGTYGHNVGECLMKVIDINNDNSNELILSASLSTDFWEREDYFYILKYSELFDSYQFYWISRLFNAKINSVFFKDLNSDQFQDIIIGLSNGNIHIFDGKNLKEIKSFKSNRKSVNSLIITDADNDDQDEIVICDNDSTTIYSLSLTIELEIPYGGKKMQIGNVDNDEELEIVLSSGNVIEVKNGVFEIEKVFEQFSYFTLFELQDVDKDDELELIYQTDYSQLTCYDLNEDNSIWTINMSSSLKSISINKNSVNNKVSIYLGTDYNGIGIFDASNGSFIGRMPDHFEGVNNVAVGDIDNDNKNEIIWSDGAYCTCEDYIYVHNLDDLSEEWRSFPLNGPFTAFDYGDLDNDGEVEFVVASESSGSHEGGVINVFNTSNGTLDWRSDPYRNAISSVKISDLNEDGNKEIMVGIEYTGMIVPATYLYIYDAKSYEMDTVFMLYNSRRIREIEVADINNDSINEIIISTGSGWSDDKCHIFILSGESKKLLWESPEFGGSSDITYSMKITNIDNDDALEIVGVEDDFWSNKGVIFVIDGQDHSILTESQFSYKCLTTGDFNNDNQQDIIAGTANGEIVILNAVNLEPISYITTESSKIVAIEIIKEGLNNNNSSIIFSDGIQLKKTDYSGTKDLWASDTINSSIGIYNSMVCYDINKDNILDVLIGSNHSINLFSLSDSEIQINDYPWDGGFSNSVDKLPGQTSTIIYPNPCYQNVIFCFDSKYQINTKIELYNLFGELVYSKVHGASFGLNRVSISTYFLPQGTYMCKAFQNNKIIAGQKLIKL